MDCFAKGGAAIHLVKLQEALRKSNVVSNVSDLLSALVGSLPKLKAGQGAQPTSYELYHILLG